MAIAAFQQKPHFTQCQCQNRRFPLNFNFPRSTSVAYISEISTHTHTHTPLFYLCVTRGHWILHSHPKLINEKQSISMLQAYKHLLRHFRKVNREPLIYARTQLNVQRMLWGKAATYWHFTIAGVHFRWISHRHHRDGQNRLKLQRVG